MPIKVYKVTVVLYVVARSKSEAESSVLRATRLLPHSVDIEDVTSVPDETELREEDIPF